MLNFLHYSLRLIRKLTPKRTINFFRTLAVEGPAGVLKRFNRHISEIQIPEYTLKINLIDTDGKFKEITDYESICFKNADAPSVSIIIPEYNQFNCIYNCLKSINIYSGDKTGYEVIVANGCSSDLTAKIKQIVSNIKIVTTPVNQAKGKYILFLNNDTQVQENWLEPLVKLMEKDDAIGAVGPRLVSGNSRLREAGGIIWSDASALNYGRMSNPAMPEFNYVKEVDYISGAALMVRKSVWEKSGGFDGSFSLACYEDIDLCFSIRKSGFKVMYQPASVVVHDVSEGEKQYQVANKKKFYEKWKNTLETENFPNGKDIFLARDRSRNRKTILVIDQYVPQFDRDAGSRTVFQYLKLFVSLGLNVKFIDDSFKKFEPYTTILEQMGIEVLYGPYYIQHWKTWLRGNGQYIDYVFLNRPHISLKYIDEVKKYTGAKVFYYGHDLRFLRESREYALTKDKKILKSSRKWKKTELEIVGKADMSYYPSQIEIDEIKKQDSSINVRVIPAYLYERLQKNNRNIENTKDIMFIGGFDHKPNIDGVLWYINEIFPILINKRPEIKTYILGSNAPEEILKLNSENIVIKGFVTDEQLNDFYKNCRLAIVPLRYGAGVKGKVVEAMYNQIPVITTAIGAEGLPEIEECLIIEDNPEQFANKLVNMYNNEKLLKHLSERGFSYIMKYFTIDNVMDIFKEDFNF